MDGAYRLSQSDFLDSQMENFLSESFGNQFNSMNPINDMDIRNNLCNAPKEEVDPSLAQFNYMSSQEIRNAHHQHDQWAPIGDNYPPAEDVDNNYPVSFAFSRGLTHVDHRFTVSMVPQSKANNRDFMSLPDLLFIRNDAPIPFMFALNNPVESKSISMPANMSIRISLRFTSPVSDDKMRVARCHVHADRDMDGLHKSFPFLINHRDAIYDDANLWVTIPASSVVAITFICFSSCAGGIDRKPVFLFFELLNQDGSLNQSAAMSIKISANPTRDGPNELERRIKEEEKRGRARVKSETSSVKGSETDGKRGRKRKTEEKEMGREAKRMESASPMSLHTPSPGWSTTMTAPRASTTVRRNSKLDLRSPSSDGRATESNGYSRKTSLDEDDDDEKVFEIKIQGKKMYEKMMEHLKILEKNERYESRHDEDNPFENLTQLTGHESISTWLGLQKLNEDNYVAAFREMGINRLDDVETHYNPSLFHASIGIPKPAAARLNRSYLNWLHVTK